MFSCSFDDRLAIKSRSARKYRYPVKEISNWTDEGIK